MNLEPCLYCASDSIKISRANNEFYAQCNGCKAQGPHMDDERDAADSWNQRDCIVNLSASDQAAYGKWERGY